MIKELRELCDKYKDTEFSQDLTLILLDCQIMPLTEKIKKLVMDICLVSECSIQELLRSRKTKPKYYRFCLVYLLCLRGYDLTHVGQMITEPFGLKLYDHSSVMHGRDEVSFMLKYNKDIIGKTLEQVRGLFKVYFGDVNV